jgi:hypothetical protein
LLLFSLIPFIFSFVTSFLFKPKAPKQKIGKLDSLTVEPSGYGTAIPLLYGKCRVPGLRAFADDLLEKKKTKKKKGQKIETYTYYFSGAIFFGIPLVNENGYTEDYIIENIFCNGQLYWSLAGDGATIDRDINGRITRVSNDKFHFRFYPGNDHHLSDGYLYKKCGNKDFEYKNFAFLVLDKLPITPWGSVPEIEAILNRDYAIADNHTIVGRNVGLFIEELCKYAKISPNDFNTDSLLLTDLYGLTVPQDGRSVRDVLDVVLNFAQAQVVPRNGQFIIRKQWERERATRTFVVQASKDCPEDNLLEIAGDTIDQLFTGYEVKFADLQRDLDVSVVSHKIGNDYLIEQKTETLDFSSITTNNTTAFQIAENVNFLSQTRQNRFQTLLKTSYKCRDILVGDTIVYNDDVFTRQDFILFVNKKTLNGDYSAKFECTDLSDRIQHSVDLNTQAAIYQTPLIPNEINSLQVFSLARLLGDDTVLDVNRYGFYVVPIANSNSMQVWMSFDGGTSFQPNGLVDSYLRTGEVVSGSSLPSKGLAGYVQSEYLDITVANPEEFICNYLQSDVENDGVNLILINGAVVGYAVASNLNTPLPSIRVQGILRGTSAISSGSFVTFLRVRSTDIVSLLDYPSAIPSGSTIYYKLGDVSEEDEPDSEVRSIVIPAQVVV